MRIIDHEATDRSSADSAVPRAGVLRKAGVIGAASTLAGGSAMAVLAALAGPANAATFTVTEATDDGTGTTSGTLSWAISQAEGDAAADVIDFSPSLTTITFTGDADQVLITKALSINGPGATALTIDFDDNCGLAAELDTDVGLSISGLTFTNGSASEGECASRDNEMGGALVVYYGGGTASLTVSGVTFVNNYAYYYGGGLGCNGDVAVTIENSAFTGNTTEEGEGGGLYLDCGQNASITSTVFSGNSSGGDGGGASVSVDTGNTVSIVDCTFSGNTASQGGGLNFENGDGFVLNSTFYGNTASFGGGIAGDSPVSIVQSTVTDNTAYTAGGGIKWAQASFSTFSLVMSTVSGNTSLSGDGNELAVFRLGGGTPLGAVIEGSIVAGAGSGSSISGLDPSGSAGPSTDFPIEVNDSILGSVDDAPIVDDGGNTLNVTDPMLGALADNGGPTKTMMPAAGSPAIDAGPVTVPVYPSNGFDQRGTPYVRVFNGRVDVGAVEAQTEPGPTPPGPDPVVPVFTG